MPVTRAWVDHRTGRRLQTIPCAEPRDHFPLCIEVDHKKMRPTSRRDSDTNTGTRWDHERIAEAYKKDDIRTKFLEAVEEKMNNSTVYSDAAHNHLPDKAWETIVETV